ncbi:chemotaxis protein CheD [Oceanispirochaeta sp.]|jgi:chemotaxis protein CheD|uniref:chemotaxis protein CheD n=1 Tax=Oceanispirochaeta sp. TaxID=2035350 RepID=UPI00261CD001|nr:chemotaxis protein CheD [Oceanispirochaeta sp.]MDA3955884.1 chemotaxis protein CheD [Oceanispirochaeta sp.]
MIEHKNHKLNRNEIILHPGDYFSSHERIIISTILGSCISVALIDSENKWGGMNHFLLPRMSVNNPDNILKDKNARYGVHAMELLINDLLKMGSRKNHLVAKVFGGGSVLNFDSPDKKNIGFFNIQFIFQFLTNERIPVTASDTGEYCGRKVLFFPDTGKVLVKKLQSSKVISDIKKEEMKAAIYLNKKKEEQKIILF